MHDEQVLGAVIKRKKKCKAAVSVPDPTTVCAWNPIGMMRGSPSWSQLARFGFVILFGKVQYCKYTSGSI